jgi:hypothetical protein
MAISLHRDSTYLDHDQALSCGGESKEGVHRPTGLMILTYPTSGLISVCRVLRKEPRIERSATEP